MKYSEEMSVELINNLRVINCTEKYINLINDNINEFIIVPPCGFVLEVNRKLESNYTYDIINKIKYLRPSYEPTKEGIKFIKSLPDDVICIASEDVARAYGTKVKAPVYARGDFYYYDKFIVFDK